MQEGVPSARATSGSSSARGAASWSPGDLGAIAEPSHGELEDSSTDAATAAHGAIGEEGAAGAEEEGGSSRASSGRQGSGEKKKKKGSKKKAAKLEPGMAEAQCAASAAVKLLAMSGKQGQLTAADEAAAGVPDYIAMGNLPTSHWQRSAPLTMPPLPVLPSIPGKRSAGAEQQQGSGPGGAGGASGGGSAGALAGAGSSGSLRPGSHQQRRISMSSAAGAVMMAASRMSISNVASSPSSAEGSTNASAGGEAVAAASSSLKVAKQGARGSSTIAVA
ncbi:hypothetical protein OEZ85_002377 [Tetradesmus obliquus]|uniref:Uncharacterized protein n=1 Tax=Tetradesmus obliquus TaxID=3088 RepID=A0ABY8U3C9_TETOB|nr:hypothetical protein OEZ85_002377 [Tetradesmus obliquus]